MSRTDGHGWRYGAAAAMALAVGAADARAGVYDNVPELLADGYSLVYSLDLSQFNQRYNTFAIPYTEAHSAHFPAGTFDRVAYYVELSGSANANRPNGFVYASFDRPAVFTDATKIGVPSNGPNGSKVSTNTTVANMNVVSNVAGITTGTGLTGGKLEFWPSNYAVGTNSIFDHDDSGFATTNGHGSMQIHNVGATPATSQTLFGYSDWGGTNYGTGTTAGELGIGNAAGVAGGHKDWTFSDGATSYTGVRTMMIFVHSTPEPAGALAVVGAGGLLLARRRTRRG